MTGDRAMAEGMVVIFIPRDTRIMWCAGCGIPEKQPASADSHTSQTESRPYEKSVIRRNRG